MRWERMLVSSRYGRATSELDGFCRGPWNRWELLVEGLQPRQDGQQCRSSQWYDDQASAFLAQRRSPPGEFEVARDSQRLVPTVSEETNLAFCIHVTTPGTAGICRTY